MNQSPISPMKGARRPLGEDGLLRLAEGEYGKDVHGVWHARPFGMHMGSLAEHDVTEHEDGTITVSPSILIIDPRGPNDIGPVEWHGYLERGVWREC